MTDNEAPEMLRRRVDGISRATDDLGRGRQLGKQTSRRRIDKSNSRDLEPEKPSVTWHQSTFSPPRSDDDLPLSRKYLARRTSSDDVRADGRADHPKKVRSRKGNEKRKESAGSPSRSGLDWRIGRSTSFDEEDRLRPEMVNAARRPYAVQDYPRARASNYFETDRYRPEMVNVPFKPSLDGVGRDGRSTSLDEEDRFRPEMVNVARRQSPDTRAKGSNSFDKNRYMPEMVNVANRPSLDGTGKVGRSSVDEGDRFGPEEANVASPDKVKDYARAKAEHPSKKLKERGDSKRSAGSKSFNSWASWSSGVRVPSPKWQELPSRRTLLYLMTRRGKALENLPMEPGDVVVCHLVKQHIVTRFHWFLAVSGSELLHLIPRDTKHQGLFARDQIDKVRKRFPNFDCNNCKNLGSGGKYDVYVFSFK
ncbi:uncharacterized protein [Bemisia tabaci]|uniref:uncharacterized protein n=1 Tax=Bemisia tabaci TaxID=7038 RepID=UPI003B2810EC